MSLATVTKPKSPGRVAAGKKLAEYNRRNKEQKQKMLIGEQQTKMPESPVSVTSEKPVTLLTPAKPETSDPYPSKTDNSSYINYVFLGGLAVVSLGYLYKRYMLKPKHSKTRTKVVKEEPAYSAEPTEPADPQKVAVVVSKSQRCNDPFVME